MVIRARSPHWARTAAQSMTGFATSVIGCKVEAGIEADLRPEETLDGRPDDRGPTGLHEAFEDEFSPSIVTWNRMRRSWNSGAWNL